MHSNPTTNLTLADINRQNRDLATTQSVADLYVDLIANDVAVAEMQLSAIRGTFHTFSFERELSKLAAFHRKKISAKQKGLAQRARKNAFNMLLEPMLRRNPAIDVAGVRRLFEDPQYHGQIEVLPDKITYYPVDPNGRSLRSKVISNRSLGDRIKRLKDKLCNNKKFP